MSFSIGDIDSIYNALRPRLKKLWGSGTGTSTTTIGPHTHSADQITFEPAGLIAAEECQASQEELDDEKLARDGTQTMLGTLQMNDNAVTGVWNLSFTGTAGNARINLVRTITMTGVGLIEAVRKVDFAGSGVGEGIIQDVRMVNMNSAVGEGVIDSPRVIHMIGDDGDNEALIDGLDRVKFNATVTQAVIEDPARIEFQVGVTPGTDYTLAEGIMSWSDLEDTMIVNVLSGPGA